MNARDDQIPAKPEAGPAYKWHHPGRWGAGIIGFLAFTVISAAGAVTFKDRIFRRPVEQPIAFNHKLHVEDNQLGCSTCHEYYEKETFSGLPDADVCAFCHSEKQGDSEEEARLVKMIADGKTLEWKSLFRQPPHVFYSHRRHVLVAKLECKTCHGDIASTTTPPTRVTKLRMQDCIDCHHQKNVSTDCTTCHR